MAEFLQKLDRLAADADRFFSTDLILLLSFCFALVWMSLFLGFNVEIYRDMASCYAWYAREFGRGEWNGAVIAALPPLDIFLGGLLVRCGMESYRALMLLGGLFFALTIFPLFGLLKGFLSEKTAAWGCFLFVMTPKLIRFSCMGLLEPTRDFFLVSAVYLIFLAWRNRAGLYHFILLGGALGLLTLSRGEGVVMAGLLFLGLLARSPQANRSCGKKILLSAFAVAAVALIVVSPRLIETWKLTGYPVPDTRCIGVMKQLPFADRVFFDKRERKPPQIDPAWFHIEFNGASPEEMGQEPLGRKLCGLAALPEQMFRGGYEPYMILAAIGIIGLIRRRRWEKEYSFLLVFSLVASVTMGFFSMAYRYFVFLVPLLMVFTLQGISAVLAGAERFHVRGLLLLVFGIVVLVQPVNAWGQLLKQKHGMAEIRMARFLKENRRRFLPPGDPDRKLVIGDFHLPEITYRADEERCRDYDQEYVSASLQKGFDVFIIGRGNKELCQYLLERKDLAEVPHPMDDQYLLLVVVQEPKEK